MGADDCGHERGSDREGFACRSVNCCLEEWKNDSQTGLDLWFGLEAGEVYGMMTSRAFEGAARKTVIPYFFN